MDGSGLECSLPRQCLQTTQHQRIETRRPGQRLLNWYLRTIITIIECLSSTKPYRRNLRSSAIQPECHFQPQTCSSGGRIWRTRWRRCSNTPRGGSAGQVSYAHNSGRGLRRLCSDQGRWTLIRQYYGSHTAPERIYTRRYQWKCNRISRTPNWAYYRV